MYTFGIVATFNIFIINYTGTIINVLFAFTAFTPSEFTRNSLIVVNQEEKEEFNNTLISASDLNTGSMTQKLLIYKSILRNRPMVLKKLYDKEDK
jgi:hypothetical protein